MMLFRILAEALPSKTIAESLDYNSLQIQYERRMMKGLQFLGAFTWSKTIDDACGAIDTCQPQLYTNFQIGTRAFQSGSAIPAGLELPLRTAFWQGQNVGAETHPNGSITLSVAGSSTGFTLYKPDSLSAFTVSNITPCGPRWEAHGKPRQSHQILQHCGLC